MLDLLRQRRVWAAIVAVLTFTLTIFKVNMNIDVPILTDLLTSFGGAVADLIVVILALWSYFKPKTVR